MTIYAAGTVPVTARGRIIETDWNVPVVMSGVGVAPGDLVIADGSGVVVIPQAVASSVIEKAEAVCAKERVMARAIRAGERVSKVMGATCEDMLRGLLQFSNSSLQPIEGGPVHTFWPLAHFTKRSDIPNPCPELSGPFHHSVYGVLVLTGIGDIVAMAAPETRSTPKHADTPAAARAM